MLLLAALFACLILRPASAQAQQAGENPKAPPEDVWSLFVDHKERYTLEFPGDWVTVNPDTDQMQAEVQKRLLSAGVAEWLAADQAGRSLEGRRVTAVGPAKFGDGASGAAVVTLIVKQLPSKVSSAYLAQMEAASAGEAAGHKDPLPIRTLGLTAGEAHAFSFSQKILVPGKGPVESRITEIILVKDLRAFVFVCVVPASEASRYESLFERVARSLTLQPGRAGADAGETWAAYPVPSAGIFLDLPAQPQLMAAIGFPVPLQDPLFVGRLVGFDCLAGSLHFFILMGFHRGGAPNSVLMPFIDGPSRLALQTLFPSSLDNSESSGGQSSSETFRPVRQGGYEGIQWDLTGSREGRKVAAHCLLFVTSGTAYLLAVYHPVGEESAARDAQRVLASCKPEDTSVEAMGTVPPFLREKAEESLLQGPWLSRPIGDTGFSLTLPEPLTLESPVRSFPAAEPGKPQVGAFSCNARGLGLSIQALTLKGVLGSASSMFGMSLGSARTELYRMGFGDSEIQSKAIDGYTVQMEATAKEMVPKLRISLRVTGREGCSCTVLFTYREDDPVAAQIVQRALKSLKAK